jgi:hypothetical protein
MLPHYGALMEEILSGEIQAECRTAQDRQALEEVNHLIQGLIHLQDRHWLAPAISFVYAQRENPQALLRFFQGLDRLAYTFFLGAMRHDDRAERFARVLAAGVDGVQLDAAFDLDADERAKVAERLRAPFGRDPWRRRAIATRVNAALPGGRNFRNRHDVTVEHVLPTSQCAAWTALGWTTESQRYHSDLIGNFVLVTAGQNQRAGQKLIAAKLGVYFEDGATVHAITADIQGATDWSEELIRARTETFARALLSAWRIAT